MALSQSVTSVAIVLAAIVATATAGDQILGNYKLTSPANATDVNAFLTAIEAPSATRQMLTSQRHDMEWLSTSPTKYTLKFHPEKGGDIVISFELGKEQDEPWISGGNVKFLGTKPSDSQILVTLTHPKYVINVEHSFTKDGATNTIKLMGKPEMVKQTFTRK